MRHRVVRIVGTGWVALALPLLLALAVVGMHALDHSVAHSAFTARSDHEVPDDTDAPRSTSSRSADVALPVAAACAFVVLPAGAGALHRRNATRVRGTRSPAGAPQVVLAPEPPVPRASLFV